LTLNYTPTGNDIINLVSATAISDTFSSVTGLPENWAVHYESGFVQIRFTAPLPVTLLSFEASLHHDNFTNDAPSVRLDWRSASEVNNLGYNIERSFDAKNWSCLTFVAGKGNTNQPADYSLIDDYPVYGINYYRLAAIDRNGSIKYSKMESVEVNPNSEISIHPNPVKNTLYIRNVKQNIPYLIHNSLGQVILSGKLRQPETVIDVSGLTKGVYYLSCETKSGQQQSERFVKN